MTLDKPGLARDAMSRAYRLRRDAGYGLNVPLCVYDLSESMSVDVWFKAIPRMEGMYVKNPGPTVVISSLRPSGRQAYTGGHELGHHVYGHGSRIDEIADGVRPNDVVEEEFLAECFSGFLLMPRPAVLQGFDSCGCTPEVAIAARVYEVSTWLGVGYDTLLTHMSVNLRLLRRTRADALRRVTPKRIKSQLVGADCPEHLVVAGDGWADRAIDIQVGDAILCPPSVVCEGSCAGPDRNLVGGLVLRGLRPGRGRVVNPETGWASFVRVSRKGFAGRARFRHLEETEDEDRPIVC